MLGIEPTYPAWKAGVLPLNYTRLSSLHAQYRAVGVNYNQTVKELKSRFSEKKAMALLYKLEKMTVELAGLSRQILALTHEFQQRWLPKLT